MEDFSLTPDPSKKGTESLGVSQERYEEIIRKFANIVYESITNGDDEGSVIEEILTPVSKLCKSKEELSLAMFAMGRAFEKAKDNPLMKILAKLSSLKGSSKEVSKGIKKNMKDGLNWTGFEENEYDESGF